MRPTGSRPRGWHSPNGRLGDEGLRLLQQALAENSVSVEFLATIPSPRQGRASETGMNWKSGCWWAFAACMFLGGGLVSIGVPPEVVVGIGIANRCSLSSPFGGGRRHRHPRPKSLPVDKPPRKQRGRVRVLTCGVHTVTITGLDRARTRPSARKSPGGLIRSMSVESVSRVAVAPRRVVVNPQAAIRSVRTAAPGRAPTRCRAGGIVGTATGLPGTWRVPQACVLSILWSA